MNFVCKKENLVDSLDMVMKAVATKTTMPILECVLITAENNKLKLLCNNLEIGIESFCIEANINTAGEVAIDAKKIFDIMRKLPDGDVFITCQENIMIIKGGRSEFKIQCMDGSNFPKLPDVDKSEIYKIPSEIFKNMIKETIFSVSLDESKAVLMGELLEIKNNKLSLVALDGFRISLRRENLNENYSDASIIVPSKTLMDISRILTNSDSEDVLLYMTNQHALFELAECKVVTRLISGSYLNYENIFTEDYKTVIKTKRQELLECVERASLICSDDKKRNPVKFKMEEDKVIITSNTELDQSYEELPANIDGEKLEIAFNPKYLTDVLKAISTDEVIIYLTTALNPCTIKPFESDKNEVLDNAKYLVLPLKLKS